ncbi:MAG: proline--tRNA ligase [Acidimicrobiia bacterium]|nr:proline--tRNA ligase [Acidimicrobiia bacterium]MDX2467730.1 proline--tRNA ligase [Acidimicrobiia bacterium]
MRWSKAFIPTLRDDPTDAEAVSHKLLVRAAFIRQLMAGVYTLLPLAYRSRRKIRKIIEEEMDSIGGQEFLFPSLHPAEIWRKSGRLDIMGDEMFRLLDRKSGEIVLGMTHEEIFTTIATELTSYKQLPQIWYQIHSKFRDEPRPKSGLLRVREFTMKDSYTFDIDQAGLDEAFDAHYAAYKRIFERIGLDAVPVEASSGAMGGSGSVEFMVRSTAGEDLVAHCPNCDYAANVERADTRVPAAADDAGPETPEKFATPGVRTIDDLVTFEGGAAADRQVKTLVYLLDGQAALVLLRGDHSLQEQKLQDHTGAIEFRPAHPEEIKELLGADAGSLGAVGVSDVNIIADESLRGRSNMTTGANDNDFHLRGVAVDRDIAVTSWASLREVNAGEPCIECGAPIDVFRAIECGHIFKLGTKYSEPLGAMVLDENGKSRPVYMGSYGIGLERNLAAVVETHHDDKGIVWPVAIAPYEVVVTVLKLDDETVAAADRIYEDLKDAGIDVIIDDRKERPGVKFNDAELVGIPYRVTVGPRGLGDGVVELNARAGAETEMVVVADVVARVVSLVESERT